MQRKGRIKPEFMGDRLPRLDACELLTWCIGQAPFMRLSISADSLISNLQTTKKISNYGDVQQGIRGELEARSNDMIEREESEEEEEDRRKKMS